MESQIAEYIEQEKLYKQKYAWHDLRKDPNDLPEKDGWVYCWIPSVNYAGELAIKKGYGISLYYYADIKHFKNNLRIDVFNAYDVMAFNLESDTPWNKIRIEKDHLCDRTDDVIAWKEPELFEG